MSSISEKKAFFADPKVWGSHAWDFMLAVAMLYPDNPDEETANNYKNFYYSLANVLPCMVCRDHLRQNINELPIENYLGNSKLLSKWVIQLHNIVNRINKKKIVGYEEGLKMFYENNKNKLNKQNKFKVNYWVVAGVSITAILVIAYFYQNHQNRY